MRMLEPTAVQASHCPDVRSVVVKKPCRMSICDEQDEQDDDGGRGDERRPVVQCLTAEHATDVVADVEQVERLEEHERHERHRAGDGGLAEPGAGPGAHTSTARVPAAITALASRIRSSRGRFRMRSSRGRGGRFIASALTGSTPIDIAGGPSMTRLTNRICSAVNGAPPAMPVSEATRNVSTKPSAVDTWKRVNLTMLA